MWLLLICLIFGLCAADQQEKVEVLSVDLPTEFGGNFEGDIDIPIEELENNLTENRRNAIALQHGNHRKWPNGIVPFEISNHFGFADYAHIRKIMKELEVMTQFQGNQCIKFTTKGNEREYVHIYKGNGCHATVGNARGKAEMSLGNGCIEKGIVMHELLHVLGFWHEQSRNDRDRFISVHYDNIKSEYSNNFDKMSYDHTDLLGQPYDYGSIMHYAPYYFASDQSKPTITTKHFVSNLGQRTDLSETDIKDVQTLYGCIQRDSNNGSAPDYVKGAPPAAPIPRYGADVCNFETGFCQWTQGTSDQTDWIRHTGTSSLGPAADPYYSTTGHYLYVDGSGSNTKTAKLHSKVFDSGLYCVKFYTYMYGENIGTLALNVFFETHKNKVNQKSTWSGNHGNQWIQHKVALLIQGGRFQIEIQGTTGIAIDEMDIYSGRC